MSVSYLIRSSGVSYPTSEGRGRFWGSAPAGRSPAPTGYMQTSPGNFANVFSSTAAPLYDGATQVVTCWWMRKSVASFNTVIIARIGTVTQAFIRSNTGRMDTLHSSPSRGTQYSTSTVPQLVDGQWHHYVDWYEAGSQPRLWVDGVEQSGTAAGAAPTAYGTQPAVDLQIGAETMDIAQLEIYSGQSLTESDVIALTAAPGTPDYQNDLTSGTGLLLDGSPVFVT